jgi:site-specific recombinase XerD
MLLKKIRFPNGKVSWTVYDEGGTVEYLRNWIIHLEEINFSPNTIEAYARHVTRLCRYLKVNGKTLSQITVIDYDNFLRWLPLSFTSTQTPENLVSINLKTQSLRLSASIKNQIHLAVKSFYRYMSDDSVLTYGEQEISTRYKSYSAFKPFLEHINNRRTARKKDQYFNGDLTAVRKKISDKRLLPDDVLELIKKSTLIRDAFLITLLYNTGMRIGEALGLHHTDIDLAEKLIWVVPRIDNENGARAKSNRTRAIPVMDYVVNMYEDYITSDEYAEAFETGTKYVFCNVQRGKVGRALSRSYAENLKFYLQKRTRIDFTWHQFRHTHASEAIADGYSLLEIADRLGHASPQTTVDFYKHLFSSEVRKLHLIGPEKLQKRLDEFRSLNNLSEGAIKWL